MVAQAKRRGNVPRKYQTESNLFCLSLLPVRIVPNVLCPALESCIDLVHMHYGSKSDADKGRVFDVNLRSVSLISVCDECGTCLESIHIDFSGKIKTSVLGSIKSNLKFKKMWNSVFEECFTNQIRSSAPKLIYTGLYLFRYKQQLIRKIQSSHT